MDYQTYIDVAPAAIDHLFYASGFIRIAEKAGTHEGEVKAFRDTVADYERFTAEFFALAPSINRGSATPEVQEKYKNLLGARSNRIQTAISLAQPVFDTYGGQLVLPYGINEPTIH